MFTEGIRFNHRESTRLIWNADWKGLHEKGHFALIHLSHYTIPYIQDEKHELII